MAFKPLKKLVKYFTAGFITKTNSIFFRDTWIAYSTHKFHTSILIRAKKNCILRSLVLAYGA